MLKVEIKAPNLSMVLPTILDIMYYSKSLEPGFEKDFPEFVPEQERFSHWFRYHEKERIFLIKTLGFDTKGIITCDGIYKGKSGAYFKTIFELNKPVQPYKTKGVKTVVEKDLKMYCTTRFGRKLVFDPTTVSQRNRPIIPVGLDLTRSDMFYLYEGTTGRARRIVERFVKDKDRLVELWENLVKGTEDPIEKYIESTFCIKRGWNYKRKLSELDIDIVTVGAALSRPV